MAIEAMSCGTPVIAFAVGIAPEVIEPDETGRVLPLGDTEQMAAAVLDFVHHPEKWREMQGKCRDRIAQPFSQETQAFAYLQLYESLLSGASTPPDATALEAPSEITHLPWNTALGPGVQPIFSTLALECLPAYVQALQTQVVQSHQAHRQLQQDHQQMRDKHHQLQARQQQLQETQKNLRQKLQQQQELKQKLTNLRNRVNYGEETIEKLHSQLGQVQDELAQVRGELMGIKSGRLWKTREAWQRLKARLGLKSP